jgi:hypothetical protein
MPLTVRTLPVVDLYAVIAAVFPGDEATHGLLEEEIDARFTYGDGADTLLTRQHLLDAVERVLDGSALDRALLEIRALVPADVFVSLGC